MEKDFNTHKMDWYEKNKDEFPKLIKTETCPNCGKRTLRYYNNDTIICGYCMTWVYEIKNK